MVKEVEKAFDAMKSIQELNEENERLKRRIYLLRFKLLPKDEQTWAMNAFYVWTGKIFWKEEDDFKIWYMKYLDSSRRLRLDTTLPF